MLEQACPGRVPGQWCEDRQGSGACVLTDVLRKAPRVGVLGRLWPRSDQVFISASFWLASLWLLVPRSSLHK